MIWYFYAKLLTNSRNRPIYYANDPLSHLGYLGCGPIHNTENKYILFSDFTLRRGHLLMGFTLERTLLVHLAASLKSGHSLSDLTKEGTFT